MNQLPMDHADKKREPWKTICWRSATMIVENKRIVTLERDQETMAWHDGWQNMFLGSTEDHEKIKNLAEGGVQHTS